MIPSRTCCHGWPTSAASSLDSRPFGVPTKYRTGGVLARIWASVASVGMPRSRSQIRSAFPYRRSIWRRKSRSVRLSVMLPDSTS